MNGHICVSRIIPPTAAFVGVDAVFLGEVRDRFHSPNVVINNHFFANTRSCMQVHRFQVVDRTFSKNDLHVAIV